MNWKKSILENIVQFISEGEMQKKCQICLLKTIYKKIKEYIGFTVRVTFTRTYLMSEHGILLACLAIENVVAS